MRRFYGVSRSFFGEFECTVQHQMQTTYGGAAETEITVTAFTVCAIVFHQVFIELLQVMCSQFCELYAANAWSSVLFNHQPVDSRCPYFEPIPNFV